MPNQWKRKKLSTGDSIQFVVQFRDSIGSKRCNKLSLSISRMVSSMKLTCTTCLSLGFIELFFRRFIYENELFVSIVCIEKYVI